MIPALNNFDIDDFLRNYWQKKPLLIRDALPGFISPLSPDELAGLACEEEIESRLIEDCGNRWRTTQGPLNDNHFDQLDEFNWTLLVQAVDHWVPEVAELLSYFRFIPNWRVDDVMVSYASKGGDAGPHYDHYDVFLIQGMGQRRWQLGQYCDQNTELQCHEQLKLLADFDAQQEWILEPGDILYLPPRFAHWGTGHSEDCMTYSVGFRAPSHAELLANFCDEQLSYIDEQQRFADPGLKHQENPGEIHQEAIDAVQQILSTYVNDRDSLAQWLGRYMTEPKYPQLHDDDSGEDSVKEICERVANTEVFRNPASRFAYTEGSKSVELYVDGKSYQCTDNAIAFAKGLCSNTSFTPASLLPFLTGSAQLLLVELFNQGCLYVETGEN